ncbi:uncharacterized protein LOC119910011 [Micropterus salmoides]|uniref:uncharacterized protein LOC119910011 n=1 Tax=Micropterus salmoides TaxID=27706 RepID=UPI0018EC6210|nr:uncharacterized protein LOC119910011 [Micropterus salmoides]
MSRGSTWGEEETKFLIEIWSDDIIKSQLEKTYKSADTFQVFSERMVERGYGRTGEQCHLKIKKLRQQYAKVCDAMRKSGALTNAKDKCPFYDDLESIPGTHPTSSPLKVVESSPPASTSSASTDEVSATENTYGIVEYLTFTNYSKVAKFSLAVLLIYTVILQKYLIQRSLLFQQSTAYVLKNTNIAYELWCRLIDKKTLKTIIFIMMIKLYSIVDFQQYRRQERENATLEKWMKMQKEIEETPFRMLQMLCS